MKKEIIKTIHETKKNLIISGDISTGKTQNIGFSLIEKIIECNENLFILDSKKEYINQYYDTLKKQNYNIVIINFQDLTKSEGWNILEYPYNLYKEGKKDKSLKFLEQIGQELFYDEQDPNSFWSSSATDLFIGTTLGLFEDGKKEEINLSSVNNMINYITEPIEEESYLAKYFKTKNLSDISYICASGSVFAPKDTKGGIASVAKQKLRLIVSRELLNKVLSKTTFNYDDIINKKTAIFFISDDETIHLNLLVAIFISELYSILIDKQSSNKFNFFLDNFDTINNISNLISMMSLGISKNIKFTILTRNKNIIEEKYGTYINNLSDEIKVTEKNIELKINNEISKINNSDEKIKLVNSHIEYPILEDCHSYIFDLKNYLINQKVLPTTNVNE